MPQPEIACCTARSPALYRHSTTGETKFANAGEQLPLRQEGKWFPLSSDNTPAEERTQLLIGKGLMWITKGAPVTRGDSINILYAGTLEILNRDQKEQGRYHVTKVEHTTWQEQPAQHIQVEYVGEMDPKKPVYAAGLANC